MNLVAFSIRTKGPSNFARRLWTVFTRFGFSEGRTRRALQTIVGCLDEYDSAPTFFIPATVLGRHPDLLREIAGSGAEIGVHGYVHNDYRSLAYLDQYKQTERAISVFQESALPYQGFRNPYLGWTDESVRVFEQLGFTYDSNEAVLHEVVDLDTIPEYLRGGFEKSLRLFQATSCSAYALRPHFEGDLVRIPTSIPDDEMLFDRLRLTDAAQVGRIWCAVLRQVYDLGGIYVLNLHPERGVLCRQALSQLLSCAREKAFPVWITPLAHVAEWWRERQRFRMTIKPITAGYWQVSADCSARTTILARNLEVLDKPVSEWSGADQRVHARRFAVRASRRPCVGVSPDSPMDVLAFLREQGYPYVVCSREDAESYALYLDIPDGLGTSRHAQTQLRNELVQRIEATPEPLLRFGLWPDGYRAALSITGDIDSVTIQDFFLRIVEVR